MAQSIKIPIHQLNEDKLKELQEKYPGAEVNLTLPAQPNDHLSETDFWAIIGLFNWEAASDEAIVQPAIETLAKMPTPAIYSFADLLSEKLYLLDQKKYALHIGEDAWQPHTYFSVDNFLYARACVIANGKDYYDKVSAHPEAMPKDMTFESILYIASEAFGLQRGKPFDYIPAYPIETYSNKAGWPD
ncbi:DUF4240 domain-containing protein [Phaeodactylibacter xiamenensis]|uniref:DUF4240 domain-containing protein n=1 Tax=Phaeodactylibacter xiamenensis TaxID=1524460 RepID=UPI003BAC5538